MSKKNKNDNEVKQEAPKSATKEIVDSIIVAFVIAIFIRTFFLGVYTIPSGSMLETLQIGDFILVNKLSYKFSDPKHDDIVVFEYPLNPKLDYIKRVIGVPGDVIEIKDKIVYRNGEKLDPDYVQYKNGFSFDMADNVPKFTVPEGFYFMMGDTQLWYSLAKEGKVHFLPEVTSVYRKNDTSVTRTKDVKSLLRFRLSSMEMRLYLCKRDNLSGEFFNYVTKEYDKALFQYQCFDKRFIPLFPINNISNIRMLRLLYYLGILKFLLSVKAFGYRLFGPIKRNLFKR